MSRKDILVLEPYYGGSHQSFLDGLQKYLPFSFHLITLPARGWKWRMRFSAPYFAARLPAARQYDAVLCSTFVDVAALRGMGPAWLREVPVFTYFHENQFAYPVQVAHERDLHFAVTNLTTACCSDGVAFNSLYNMESFFKGCREIEGRIPDMKVNVSGELREKSVVLYPGVDFSQLDDMPTAADADGGSPVIIWNHRWEHDKNPELFSRTLLQLDALQIDYKLVMLGQSFAHHPGIFDKIRERLGHRLLHAGYVADKEEYYRWLRRGTVVVSTANHEFFGIAVMEAVRAGCRPLLPDRLSYPEFFPPAFLYKDDDLLSRLRDGLRDKRLAQTDAQALTERFSWPALAGRYADWLNT